MRLSFETPLKIEFFYQRLPVPKNAQNLPSSKFEEITFSREFTFVVLILSKKYCEKRGLATQKKKLYNPLWMIGFDCLKATEPLRGDSLFFIWYSFNQSQRDERLCQPQSYPAVLNPRPLGWESIVWGVVYRRGLKPSAPYQHNKAKQGKRQLNFKFQDRVTPKFVSELQTNIIYLTLQISYIFHILNPQYQKSSNGFFV